MFDKLSQLWRRLLFYLRREGFDRELEEEMRFHLEMKAEENAEAGMELEEACYAAQRQFGNQTFLREVSRDMWAVRSIETLFQDLRYGARMLLKNPGFALIAAFTLALGIGANTAIFSFVNALLLRPLKGVSDPEQLVQVVTTFNNRTFDQVSYPNYLDYSQQNTTLSGLAMHQHVPMSLSEERNAELITGAMVTGNYFETLGVKAEVGRLIMTADGQGDGANPVAVLSYNLWRNRFGADPNIIGRGIRLNNYAFTVLGVASGGFVGTVNGEAVDVWVPVTMWRQANPQLARLSVSWKVDWFKSRDSRFLSAFGRLKPGVTIEQAQAEFSTIVQRLKQTYPETNQKAGVRLTTGLGLSSDARGQMSEFVRFPLVIVGIVLLIACANVAGLLLARANARRKEIGIRLALGASASRIIRQLLTESVLLALIGGFLGVFVAIGLSQWLRTSLPDRLLRMPLKFDLELDVRVLGFTIFVSVLTGLLSGLAPAWHSARHDLIPTLKDQSGSGPRLGQTSFRGVLVIAQIALSLVLLIAAGLCVRTLQNTQEINVGFDTERVLTARVDLVRQQYSETQGRQFFGQLLERIAAIPGIQSASFAHDLPLTGDHSSTGIYPENRPDENSRVQVSYNIVTPQYLETVSIPLLLGRPFSVQDSPQSPMVAIINETLAQRVWPNENPIGKRFRFSDTKGDQPLIEVIGVAHDAKGAKLFDAPPPNLYLHFTQRYQGQMVLHLRANGQPEKFIAAMRQEIAKLDPRLPVYDVKTLASYRKDALTPQRLTALLVSGFGGLATLLAMIGLYGVMAATVSQRTREIGIRMALGAQARDVIRLIVGQGMKLAMTGTLIGLASAWALTRLMKSLLFRVSATDPLTFIVITLLLAIVALLACWIPARRAAKVDPITALRFE